MGPTQEALDLARQILIGRPDAQALEIDLAYHLMAAGERWLDERSKGAEE